MDGEVLGVLGVSLGGLLFGWVDRRGGGVLADLFQEVVVFLFRGAHFDCFHHSSG